MKNIHILPTDKPSRLINSGEQFNLFSNPTIDKRCVNIYIISDEEIKDYNWYISSNGKLLQFTGRNVLGDKFIAPKVILTTDPELIKDGVQAIDDDFLEWFVKNPRCENTDIKTENICGRCYSNDLDDCWSAKECSDGKFDKIKYKTIIPKEEPNYNMKQEILAEMERLEEEPKHILYTGKVWEPPKQETLEEAAERIFTPNYIFYKVRRQGFVEGAKWQAERMYSEEDMIEFHKWAFQKNRIEESDKTTKELLLEWFEQYKKKV